MPHDLPEMAVKLIITIDPLLPNGSKHVGTNFPGCCVLPFGRNLLIAFREPLLA